MIFGAYFVFGGWKLRFGGWHQPGPGFIAVLTGSVLLALSGLLLATTVAKKHESASRRVFFAAPGALKRVLLVGAALVAFVLILAKAGFVLSCFLLMAFLLRAIEPQSWRCTLFLAFLTTIACVIVFQVWLKVEFPEGLINVYAIQRRIF